MDVERAIEHILHMQAQAEARADRAEARMDRTDRQMKAIQKLIQTGMKLIVRIEAGHKRLDAKMVELAEAQLRTDRKMEKLIDNWNRRTPNGRG
jgi:hypothetical protein